MFKRLDDMPRRQWWMFLCLLGVFAGFVILIGRDDGPLMLAYQTGYGDGTFPVTGDYAGDRLVQIRLEFGS